MKKRLENSENEYSTIQKQLTNSQSTNSDYNKQIEKLNLDLEKQFKTAGQFQVYKSSSNLFKKHPILFRPNVNN